MYRFRVYVYMSVYTSMYVSAYMCVLLMLPYCSCLGCHEAESAQIIIPAREVRRRNDIYVAVVSSSHMVAARGMFIAIVSTTVETANPIAELNPGINLLGPIVERCGDALRGHALLHV